jgi:predicted DCC family thiol-disulfide oxidoreductase YuxK
LPDSHPVLLYDGVCALCNGWVKLVLRFDRRASFRFAPLDSPAGRLRLAAHPALAGLDSIVLLEDDRASVRSTAVLRIFARLGGLWRLLLIGYLIPREIRDSLYDVVAHWRYRIFGRHETCPLPPAEVRDRFLPDPGAGAEPGPTTR